MNFFELCGPVILYLGFSIIQIILDLFRQNFNIALAKFIVMIIFSVILNILCAKELTIIAWFIVFIPFIFMTVISTLLVIAFGIDPNASSRIITPVSCSDITNQRLCHQNNCIWRDINNDGFGRCFNSNHIGRRVGRQIADGMALKKCKRNIGGDPATWSPTIENNNIGGDPATWSPTNEKDTPQNLNPNYYDDLGSEKDASDGVYAKYQRKDLYNDPYILKQGDHGEIIGSDTGNWKGVPIII